MKKKFKNEEMAQIIDRYVQLDKQPNSAQNGKLGYALAVNKRRIAEAVQDYVKLKNDKVQSIIAEAKNNPALTSADADAMNKEVNEKLQKDLGDVPWIEEEVDIVSVTPEEFYSGTFDSRQMEQFLWMVDDNEKEDK